MTPTRKALLTSAGLVVALVGVLYFVHPADPEPTPLRIAWAATSTVMMEWDHHPWPTCTGFVVYYGTESRKYTSSIDVPGNPPAPSLQLDLPIGTRFFAALTAYDETRIESAFSNEINFLTVRNTLIVTPAYIPATNQDGTRSLWRVPTQASEDLLHWTTLDGDGPFRVNVRTTARRFYRPLPGYVPFYDRP